MRPVIVFACDTPGGCGPERVIHVSDGLFLAVITALTFATLVTVAVFIATDADSVTHRRAGIGLVAAVVLGSAFALAARMSPPNL